MSSTVTANDGTQLPLSDLAAALTYDSISGLIQTITVVYAGNTYRQTYSNNGTAITSWTGWVKQ